MKIDFCIKHVELLLEQHGLISHSLNGPPGAYKWFLNETHLEKIHSQLTDFNLIKTYLDSLKANNMFNLKVFMHQV